jgi:hypothetical protein
MYFFGWHMVQPVVWGGNVSYIASYEIGGGLKADC